MTYHSPFNIRVYGILINSKNEVLITDEYRMDMYMTKFPGGGLEFGEGTIDCLKREFKEELNIEINTIQHFYTTDYFQPTQFFDNTQLISIYYTAETKSFDKISCTTKRNDFEPVDENQAFRWIKLKDLKPDEFTFPIDKKVALMLRGL